MLAREDELRGPPSIFLRSFHQEVCDDSIYIRQIDPVKTIDFVEGPGQEPVAGRAVRLEIAVMLDGFVLACFVSQKELVAHDDCAVVLSEAPRLRTRVVKSLGKEVLAAAWAREGW
jgi:hypothetical protein